MTRIQKNIQPLLVIKMDLLNVPRVVKNFTTLQSSCRTCTSVQGSITQDVQKLVVIKDQLLQVGSQLAQACNQYAVEVASDGAHWAG